MDWRCSVRLCLQSHLPFQALGLFIRTGRILLQVSLQVLRLAVRCPLSNWLFSHFTQRFIASCAFFSPNVWHEAHFFDFKRGGPSRFSYSHLFTVWFQLLLMDDLTEVLCIAFFFFQWCHLLASRIWTTFYEHYSGPIYRTVREQQA